MTTFWARQLIFTAWQNGKITEGCAQYFDELIEKYSTTTTPSVFNAEVINCTRMNDPSTYCVLGNIGAVNNPEEAVRNFDILRYIRFSTFKNGKKCAYEHKGPNNTITLDKTVYLATLIGEEYAGLDNNISSLIKHGKPSIEDLKVIKNYLYDTKYLPTKKGTPRDASYLIGLIDYQIRNIRNEQDLAKWKKEQSKNDKELIMF